LRLSLHGTLCAGLLPPLSEPVVDALYIQFLETTVTTEHLVEGIAADYDAQGKLAGIEILDALKLFSDPRVLRQVIHKDVRLDGV